MSRQNKLSSQPRRSFLVTAGKATAAFGLSQLLPLELNGQSQPIPGKERLIVRSAKPEDLETPAQLLNSWITPNDLFYVRHHMYAPDVKAESWSLKVDGEVNQPLTLTLDDLKKMPKTTMTATLECAGNGRAFHDPAVAGVQWEKGAVGTARWGGVRLADVLKKAGLKPSAKFIFLDGADVPLQKMPDFIRQVPLEKALHPDTLLAYEMNGQVLPVLHGFPLRAVVPGWEGAYAVKWLAHIQASDKENEGFWVKTAYRYPTKRVAPGAAVDPKDMAPVAGLFVKSIITSPAEGTSLKVGGSTRVTGLAWAGEANITKVDISLDNGSTWTPAKLGKDQAKYTWRQFEYEFKPSAPGSFLVMARATDDKGRTQPIVAQWNPSGYFWNAIDRVRINVEA